MRMAFFRNPLNLTAKSKATRRRLLGPKTVQLAIEDTRRIAAGLRDGSQESLATHGDRLRSFARRRDVDDDQATLRLVSLTGGGVVEAVRRCLSIDLFDVQIHAGIAVALGAVAEMQTGEGKTLALATPICFHSLMGKGVHVATPNEYLAKRDCQALKPILQMLGVSVDVTLESDSEARKTVAYDADVTYGAGHAFGFDYLRDQLAIGEQEHGRLGGRLLSRLRLSDRRQGLQRPLASAIIDEVDHVLIDDAVSPLILSQPRTSTNALDEEIHLAARSIVPALKSDRDYQLSTDSIITLTEVGFQNVYTYGDWAIHPQLVRPWHEYVILALRATFQFQREVDYVVTRGEIHVVDQSTGRIFESRTWSDGIHQAIEAKEQVSIRCEAAPMASMTRQRFYRLYPFVAGVTGTAMGCERELSTSYGLPVVQIPLRATSRRRLLPMKVTRRESGKLQAIAEETQAFRQKGRAVLIGTTTISESREISSALSNNGIPHSVLNGLQDANEADLVSSAGRCGAVTVATNMAGRGTDIQLTREVADNGGLHVIVTQMQPLARVDRQLIGRCARCGDAGSARVYVSADDLLPKQHAPWVRRAIERFVDGEDSKGIEEHLCRIQLREEKRGAVRRWRLLLADQVHEDLLTRSPEAVCCDRLIG